MPGGHQKSPAQRNAEAFTAVELHARGFNHDEIAEELGVSPRTVKRRIREGLDLQVSQDVDVLRAEAEVRLDVGLREVAKVLTDPDATHELRLKAVHALLALEARRAKLLGTDFPRAVIEEEARAMVEG